MSEANGADSIAPTVSVPDAPTETPDVATPKIEDAPKTTPIPDKYKIKYNGREEELDRDEVLRRASLGSAAEERFQEAAKAKKYVESHKAALKKDFMEALLDPELGLTKEQIRTRFEGWYKENYIDPEAMSPEQRELAELKKEKADRERKEKETKEEEAKRIEAEAEEKLINHHRETIQKQFIEAAEKVGLPRRAETIRRMAYFQKQNLDRGYDAPMDYVAEQVKKSFQEEQAGLAEGLDGEALVKFLGESIVDKIRKYDLARLSPKATGVSAGNSEPRPARKATGKKTFADVSKYFDSL